MTSIATMSEETDGTVWDKKLGLIRFSINNTYHQYVKQHPHKLLLSYESRSVKGYFIKDELRNAHDESSDIQVLREDALTAIKENQTKQRERYTKKKCRKVLEIGDVVVVQREASATDGPKKVLSKYKRQYIIN